VATLAALFLTLIALAWGVALVCAIDVVNRAVLSAFVEVIDTMAGRAALEIAAGEGALSRRMVADPSRLLWRVSSSPFRS